MELAPDVRVEVLRILAWSRLGAVMMTRSFGTHDGGAFENPALVLALTGGPLVERYELFDLGDTERTLARLDELCAGLA